MSNIELYKIIYDIKFYAYSSSKPMDRYVSNI